MKFVYASIMLSLISGFSAASEPYVEFLAACDRGIGNSEQSLLALTDVGWRDKTSTDAYRNFMTQTRNVEARAKLSVVSYPEPWNNASVSRAYPSTYASNLDQLADKIALGVADTTDLETFILVDSKSASRVGFFAGSNCWFLGMASENPTIRDALYSRGHGIERGFYFNSWHWEGRRFGIGLLSSHAKEVPDPRFLTNFDLILSATPGAKK